MDADATESNSPDELDSNVDVESKHAAAKEWKTCKQQAMIVGCKQVTGK